MVAPLSTQPGSIERTNELRARFRTYLGKVGSGEHTSSGLSREEAAEAMELMLDGIATPVQIGSFLIAYRIRTERFVARIEEKAAQVHGAPAKVYSYSTDFDALHHIVMVFGDVRAGEDIPCRIYREQPMEDMVARFNGERGWMDAAVKAIDADGGRGVIIILPNPMGHDASIDEHGNEGDGKDGEKHGSALKRQMRWREVGVGAQILRDLGISSIALITTSDRQYVGLGGFGIEIKRTIRI